MMPYVMEFVKSLHLSGRVLDIGSLDVNGCVREYFTDYTGLDMRPGPNVDIVANAHKIPFSDQYFDLVLNLETMEHDDRFWETAREMYRVCIYGGHVVITAPTIGFPKHDYPSDYWRFLPEGMISLMSSVGFQCLSCHQNDSDVFYHGIKI